MKIITMLLAATAICLGLSVRGLAQSRGDTIEYQIGGKKISIPSPDGFVEAASQIPEIKERFTVTEAAGNDLLAAYIPAKEFQQFKEGNFSDLNFYTKVSVSKRLKTQNITQLYFTQFVASFKKNFPALIDPEGEQMKGTIKSLSENLSKLNNEKTDAALSQPVNLGLITESQNAFGTILLMRITIASGGQENTKPLLAGISAIRVREKIVFIYTYKLYEKDQDIDDLRQFSKKWIGQISAANKNAQ